MHRYTLYRCDSLCTYNAEYYLPSLSRCVAVPSAHHRYSCGDHRCGCSASQRLPDVSQQKTLPLVPHTFSRRYGLTPKLPTHTHTHTCHGVISPPHKAAPHPGRKTLTPLSRRSPPGPAPSRAARGWEGRHLPVRRPLPFPPKPSRPGCRLPATGGEGQRDAGRRLPARWLRAAGRRSPGEGMAPGWNAGGRREVAEGNGQAKPVAQRPGTPYKPPPDGVARPLTCPLGRGRPHRYGRGAEMPPAPCAAPDEGQQDPGPFLRSAASGSGATGGEGPRPRCRCRACAVPPEHGGGVKWATAEAA